MWMKFSALINTSSLVGLVWVSETIYPFDENNFTITDRVTVWNIASMFEKKSKYCFLVNLKF